MRVMCVACIRWHFVLLVQRAVCSWMGHCLCSRACCAPRVCIALCMCPVPCSASALFLGGLACVTSTQQLSLMILQHPALHLLFGLCLDS